LITFVIFEIILDFNSFNLVEPNVASKGEVLFFIIFQNTLSNSTFSQENNFVIYPNPTTFEQGIHISTQQPSSEIYEYRIYNCLGQVIEKYFFGYNLNSRSEPDFTEAGIELKVCPLKRIKPIINSNMLMKRQGLTVKERISLGLIDYNKLINETWETASIRKKMKLLLMFYIHETGISVDEVLFDLVNLWEPSASDLRIIESDWEYIKTKVMTGNAQFLSEGDTMYLGACTKGANNSHTRFQPFSESKAMQRAFSLKRSYVDFIYEELLQNRISNSMKNSNEISQNVFEIIINNLNSNINMNLSDLINKYGITRLRNAKNYLNLFTRDLISKILNSPISEISELDKSGIEIKSILLQPNGVPRESMSFEQIDFIEIIGEEWFDYTFRDKFENKKHLWVVFKSKINYSKQSDLELTDIEFFKAFFWNIPIVDLEESIYEFLTDTVVKLKNGIYNDVSKSDNNPVGHIRPKAKDSEDLMLTTQGTYEKKVSFWINEKYIADQVSKTV